MGSAVSLWSEEQPAERKVTLLKNAAAWVAVKHVSYKILHFIVNADCEIKLNWQNTSPLFFPRIGTVITKTIGSPQTDMMCWEYEIFLI